VPQISLTTFVDFVNASGTPRLTCVRDAKAMYEQKYDPRTDFWKALREAIVEVHVNGRPVSDLNQLLCELRDVKKRSKYPNHVKMYQRFIGRKEVKWLGVDTVDWTSGDLRVRVNPELGLLIDDKAYVVKLYLKGQQPTKLRSDTILHLIRETLSTKQAKAIPGLLDVGRGKLIVPTVEVPGLGALLRGEAAAFASMWKQL
jgi:hypothetical protein